MEGMEEIFVEEKIEENSCKMEEIFMFVVILELDKDVEI